MMYVAATLTRESQDALYKAISNLVQIPDNWTKYCHHMTIRFKPGPNDELPNFNMPVGLVVTEYAADERGVAVKVEPNTNRNELKMAPGQLPHITVATAPGVSPVYSNELLKGKTVKFPTALILESFTWAKTRSGGFPERDDLAVEKF